MFATSRTTKLLLHVANLAVIFFILLPVAAVFIGSIQSEKALQADTRRLLPLEFTTDNFTVILTKGEQKGRIFDQATYLPENIKGFYSAFANSAPLATFTMCSKTRPPTSSVSRRRLSSIGESPRISGRSLAAASAHEDVSVAEHAAAPCAPCGGRSGSTLTGGNCALSCSEKNPAIRNSEKVNRMFERIRRALQLSRRRLMALARALRV